MRGQIEQSGCLLEAAGGRAARPRGNLICFLDAFKAREASPHRRKGRRSGRCGHRGVMHRGDDGAGRMFFGSIDGFSGFRLRTYPALRLPAASTRMGCT
ncbi:hypothetical protein OCAR_5115 [Afipia carboxidovorans OM5]|nr:hypothetical protein OCAR_5115 [Afipia carboxidovorans OM5]